MWQLRACHRAPDILVLHHELSLRASSNQWQLCKICLASVENELHIDCMKLWTPGITMRVICDRIIRRTDIIFNPQQIIEPLSEPVTVMFFRFRFSEKITVRFQFDTLVYTPDCSNLMVRVCHGWRTPFSAYDACLPVGIVKKQALAQRSSFICFPRAMTPIQSD